MLDISIIVKSTCIYILNKVGHLYTLDIIFKIKITYILHVTIY